MDTLYEPQVQTCPHRFGSNQSQQGENVPAGSIHWLGGPGAYSWQGFFSTKFVNNPRLDTVMQTMSTPGFDGALPHNLRMVAAATAAVID